MWISAYYLRKLKSNPPTWQVYSFYYSLQTKATLFPIAGSNYFWFIVWNFWCYQTSWWASGKGTYKLSASLLLIPMIIFLISSMDCSCAFYQAIHIFKVQTQAIFSFFLRTPDDTLYNIVNLIWLLDTLHTLYHFIIYSCYFPFPTVGGFGYY